MNYIWIIFALLFLALATYHFWRSVQKITPFSNKGGIKTFNGVPLGVGEFVEDFNKHLEVLNHNNQIINVVAGIGYLLASLTALVSYLFSCPSG